MKELLAKYHLAIIGAALIADLGIIFGPPLIPHPPIVLLLARWILMMIGIQSFNWAYRREAMDLRRRNWLSAYLIWGFTAAGALNGAVNVPA